mgnify:CR=1 FL=1
MEEKDNEIQQNCSEEDLRLQVLQLTKDILQQKAAMRWETHKKCEDITIDQILHESKKLLDFIKKG